VALGATAECRKGTEATFAGRYRLLETLDVGALGQVYRALDLRLGIPVAVRIFDPGSPMYHEWLIDRLHRAACSASLNRHPHVVDTIDFVWEREGRVGIVVEFVDGVSFASLRSQSEAPSCRQICHWIAQLLAGVATGTAPFGLASESPGGAGGPPVPPSELNPKLPTVFDAVTFRGLSPKPSHRYVSARAMREEILHMLEPTAPQSQADTWSHSASDHSGVTLEELSSIPATFDTSAASWMEPGLRAPSGNGR
jgi:serine/threonine protein kinase